MARFVCVCLSQRGRLFSGQIRQNAEAKTEIGPPLSDRALYSDKARSFNQSERALYRNFNIIKNKTNIGPRIPNLSQKTDILNNYCDLINTSLVGKYTDIIYIFSTSVLQSSYSFTLEPKRVTFNPVNKNILKEIRMYVTDGKRRIVNLYGAFFFVIFKTNFSINIFLIIKMKPYEFRRVHHPKLGRFVYKNKGNGIIIDNIFKPLRKMVTSAASSVFGNLVKLVAKKSFKIWC